MTRPKKYKPIGFEDISNRATAEYVAEAWVQSVLESQREWLDNITRHLFPWGDEDL